MTEKDGGPGPQETGATHKAQDAPDHDEKGVEGAEGGDIVHLRPPKPCPTCGKPSTRKAYPFCSGRCADVDLNRWLTGRYVVPGRPLEDGDEQEA